MRIRLLTLVFGLIGLYGCQQSNNENTTTQQTQKPEPKAQPVAAVDISGQWRGVLASPGGDLPFGLLINKAVDGYTAVIINGDERADTSHVTVNGQAVEIGFDWYDAAITAKVQADGSMQGRWRKTASGGNDSTLPFTATRGYSYRFSLQPSAEKALDISGTWKVIFTDEDGDSDAVGEFTQIGKMVSGTFLTPTGDYRYLEGNLDGNSLKLSTFDGAHAFLFTAEWQDGSLHNGNFWSRDTYHATWSAFPTDKTVAELLPDSWDMVQMTSADQKVSFAFEDLQGNTVQLTDARFQGKPVLVNLFGSWCPNCNDEAPVLAEFYRQYQPRGLEIVGLAFEYTGDTARDKKQIAAFKQRYGIDYPLLLAGVNDKEEAAKTLGFLDKVVAYPTSIFLDHNHNVIDIHSGFAGPGTGDHYKELVADLEQRIQQMVAAYQADQES